MKYQKRITLQTLNEAFSLMEIVIVISVSTFFLLLMVGGTFSLHRGFQRSQEKAVVIKEMSEFIKTVSIDIYNPDIFPHRSVKDYSFNEKSIVFFANGKKVEYGFGDGVFYISKNEDKKEFPFIKNFSVSYYDRDNMMVFDEGVRYYCEFTFVFYDDKEIKLRMRL